MARSSMTQLIGKVRTLVGDTTSPETFSDDDIQDALDVWRTERRFVPLRPQPTFGAGIVYLDYYADAQYWESDVVLQLLSYAVATPDLSELLVGHWHFAIQPDGIGLRATGKTYDVYASAADVLEAWAAQLKLQYTVQVGGDTYQRGQQLTMILDLAQKYRANAMPHSGRIVQSDAAPDHDGGGVTYPNLTGWSNGG